MTEPVDVEYERLLRQMADLNRERELLYERSYDQEAHERHHVKLRAHMQELRAHIQRLRDRNP